MLPLKMNGFALIFFSQGKWPDELASEDKRTLLFSIPSRNTLYENGSGPRPQNMNGESLFSEIWGKASTSKLLIK